MGSRSSIELALLCAAASRRSLASDVAALRHVEPSSLATVTPLIRDRGAVGPVH